MRWCVFAALLFAAPAHAVVGVIVDGYDPQVDIDAQFENGQFQMVEQTKLMFGAGMETLKMREGVEWDWLSPHNLKTQQVRLGVVPYQGGTKEYDAFIVLDFAGRINSSGGRRSYTNGLRTDSLTLSSTSAVSEVYNRKPILFLNGSSNVNSTWAGSAMSDGATGGNPCTTGVAASKSWGASGLDGWPKVLRSEKDPDNGFVSPGHVGAVVMNSTPPAGGVRPLLRFNQNPEYLVRNPQNQVAWLDSTQRAYTADTLDAWVRLMAHNAGSAQLIFANILGAGPCPDSLGDNQGCEGDFPKFAFIMAYLDSLTGGNVLNHGALPLRVAVTVHEGLASGANATDRLRGEANFGGAMYLGDSTAVKVSLQDSVGVRRLPLTFGLDYLNLVDSSSTITAAQKAWFSRVPRARFSPQLRPKPGNASWLRPLDPFGHQRARVIYGGEDCNTGGTADTTMYCLLRSAKWHLDSIPEFRGRVSNFALPYKDDWTPTNATAANIDSILWVIRKVFPGGVLVDGQSKKADPKLSNPLGWHNYPRREPIAIDGKKINLLGHSGHMISGARLLVDARDDSIPPYEVGAYATNEGRHAIPFRETHRAWQALAHPYRDVDVMPDFNESDASGFYDGVNTPIADYLYGIRNRTNVLKFHVNDFGAGTTPARRPAWWTIKWIDNAMRAINSFGTNVVVWAYPEDMEP